MCVCFGGRGGGWLALIVCFNCACSSGSAILPFLVLPMLFCFFCNNALMRRFLADDWPVAEESGSRFDM